MGAGVRRKGPYDVSVPTAYINPSAGHLNAKHVLLILNRRQGFWGQTTLQKCGKAPMGLEGFLVGGHQTVDGRTLHGPCICWLACQLAPCCGPPIEDTLLDTLLCGIGQNPISKSAWPNGVPMC